MKKYAKVIVRSNTIYTDNLFTYQIPVFLSDVIKIGHRILVPFGKGNKPTEAFVFQFTDCLFLVDDTGADSLDFIQCSIIYQISTYSEDVMNGIRVCFSYY